MNQNSNFFDGLNSVYRPSDITAAKLTLHNHIDFIIKIRKYNEISNFFYILFQSHK